MTAENTPANGVLLRQLRGRQIMAAENTPANDVLMRQLRGQQLIAAENTPANGVLLRQLRGRQIIAAKDTPANSVLLRQLGSQQIMAVENTPANGVLIRQLRGRRIMAAETTPANDVLLRQLGGRQLMAAENTSANGVLLRGQQIISAEDTSANGVLLRQLRSRQIIAVEDTPANGVLLRQPGGGRQIMAVENTPVNGVLARQLRGRRIMAAETTPANDVLLRQLRGRRITTSANTSINDVPGTSLQPTPTRTSQMNIYRIRLRLDKQILDEFIGHVSYDTKGFFKKYFEGKSWSVNESDDSYNKLIVQYVDGRWSGWPEPPVQDKFIHWFMMFQDTILNGFSCKYYALANRALKGSNSEANHKLDIFLASTDVASTDVASSNSTFRWSDVLVIGVHEHDPLHDHSLKSLLHLTMYAREIFRSQLYRRFVHGFTICGSLMRLWVFDRSGAYSSESFDIHNDPNCFVTAIRGYALMTKAELGMNTFVQDDGTNRYIMANDTKIFLQDQPIATQRLIVCRGTTCFRGSKDPKASHWDYAVKFSWTLAKLQREGGLLKTAKDRGVTGIAEWVHHEQIKIDGKPDTIVYLRSGLQLAYPSLPLPQFNYEVDSSETRASSREKRGRGPNDDEGNDRKRSKLDDDRDTSGDEATAGDYSLGYVDLDSLLYENRIHDCVVVTPAGRPLSTYTSVKELLEAFRDAIRGHQSLYEDGDILHRDISENNIIINESADKRSPKGLLIDLDMAADLRNGPPREMRYTGTKLFMAIGILKGKDHTYLHDLESFFYVFIWMCICYGHRSFIGEKTAKSPGATILQGWFTGSLAEIAKAKSLHISNFDTILAEFSTDFACLKGLALSLRKFLFRRHVRSQYDPHVFQGLTYSAMVSAFNQQIRALETEAGEGGDGEEGGEEDGEGGGETDGGSGDDGVRG